jgi:hypothetical protein
VTTPGRRLDAADRRPRDDGGALIVEDPEADRVRTDSPVGAFERVNSWEAPGSA